MKKLIFWMKFRSHGTYINPNNVVETAKMPAVLVREKNWRRHNPSTKRIRKLVSKSLTLAGEPEVPTRPVRFKNVPTINNRPPSSPHHLKQNRSRFSANP